MRDVPRADRTPYRTMRCSRKFRGNTLSKMLHLQPFSCLDLIYGNCYGKMEATNSRHDNGSESINFLTPQNDRCAGPCVACGSFSNFFNGVRFEVLTALTMKSSIIWDATLCSLMNVKRCFGGTYRLHLQVQKVSQARNQNEAGGK
jgi:hypothetical protein